ncbi:hypothetical protein [Vibrio parahaemolyticus]|uniref:hypothetical protein n=1 Tax=Vibrio parahaemolyticus TaxID=670 RepID=UPI00329A7C78
MLDSKLEAKWTPLLQRLGFTPLDKTFQQVGAPSFYDSNGTPFNAKGDYYHPDLDLFVELKGHALNQQPDITSCESGLREQINYHLSQNERAYPKLNTLHTLRDKRSYCDNRQYSDLSTITWNSPFRRDSLNYAWNHSATKQKIVQDHILAGGSRSEVWFCNTGKERNLSVASALTHGIHAKPVSLRHVKNMLKTGHVPDFEELLSDSFKEQTT